MYKYFHDAVKNAQRPNNHDEIYDFLLTHLYSLELFMMMQKRTAHRLNTKMLTEKMVNTKQVNNKK